MEPVTLKTLLDVSDQAGWAFGHFNIHNLEFARGVIQAAEQEKAPAAIAIGMLSIKYIGLPALAAGARALLKDTDMPLAIHLDHARDLNVIKQALDHGFSSVMFDGSSLSFEENVEMTKKVVEMAKPYGASVEGEVGIVPHGDAVVDAESMTDPSQAVEFAERTGVDMLAVSLGSVHGMTSSTASLNQELLSKLRDAVPVPLVLHGASGVKDDQIEEAVANGIRKINVNTQLKQACRAAMQKYQAENPKSDFLADLTAGIDGIAEAVAHNMRLFKSSGKCA